MSRRMSDVVVVALLATALAAPVASAQDAGGPDAIDAGQPSAPPPAPDAAVPVPEEVAPASAPVGDEAVAAALANEDLQGLFSVEEPSYPNLSLYGFADFTFVKLFAPKNNLISLYSPTQSTFALGNVNLYVDSQISRRARSLIEVRLSFLPDGATTIEANTAQVRRVNTDVPDTRILGRISTWGSITIERVVLSYDFTPWLTLSVGRLITPWGLWNIDHGTPSLITVLSPLFVDGQYIPARQTGIQASGQWAWPDVRAGYYLTLSNGRGPVETYRDFDENKAVGGRVYGTFSYLGELTLGFTFYVGRATDPIAQYVRLPVDGKRARVETTQETHSLEKAVSADLKWEYKGTLVMTEFVATGRTYENRHRGAIEATTGALVSDGRRQITSDSLRYGGYFLVGHRFRFLGTMPFFDFEYNMDTESFLFPRLLMPQLGINMRPEPGLVLKLVGGVTYFKDAQPNFFGEQPKFWYVNSQVAWAF
ncbi:MAG: hypothetical protein ABW252_09635 [Polyangiales bacterium]